VPHFIEEVSESSRKGHWIHPWHGQGDILWPE
jgi:hypothetical protein